LGVLFPIYGKIKNVPNHQPVISGLSLLNDHAIWVCPGPEWGHDPNIITMGKIMTNPWILGYPDPEIGYAVSPKYDHLNEVLMLKKKKLAFPQP